MAEEVLGLEIINTDEFISYANVNMNFNDLEDLTIHFKDDEEKEILDELIQHGFDTIYENLDLNKDGIVTKEEFIHFIKHNFSLVRENIQHWKLFFSLLVQPHVAETFSQQYNTKGEPVFLMMYNFIKSQGSKDPEGDLMAISSMLEGAFLYCVVAPEVFPIDTLEEKIINACFKIVKN